MKRVFVPFLQAARNQEWIEKKDFETACQKIRPKLSADQLYTIPRWLHNSGLVIYFGDHPILSERIFIEPVWVTQNIYEILDETVLDQQGEFSRQQVEDKKPELAETFLALMQQMEIIFERRDQPGNYVAPQYLPDDPQAEDLFAIAAGGLQRSAFSIRLPLNEEVRLIPILLQPLDYDVLRIDPRMKALIDKEMLPKNDSQKLVPVTLWGNQEEAFAKIAARVREAIDGG